MLAYHSGLQYYLYAGAVDMRKGCYSLAGLVSRELGKDPLKGEVFIFLSASARQIKITVLEPLQDITGLTQIGQDVTEMLDYTPFKLIVRQYIRPKYARPKGAGIITAELPEFPITKGIAGSGLLTQLIIRKFIDGLPIYRQVEIFKRQDVELSTATIAGWIKAATELLFPLYENLQKQVLSSRYAQVDETRLQVLDRLVKGKSVRGWIWAYHSLTKRLVKFDYAEGRGKENPVKHLQNFQGYLQTDGYAV